MDVGFVELGTIIVSAPLPSPTEKKKKKKEYSF
jgi:hypothetical protein